MAALPRPEPLPTPVSARSAAWEEMDDPLHPMHQELLRRVSGDAARAPEAAPGGWSGPARMAAVFYLGLASWAAVVGTIMLFKRLI